MSDHALLSPSSAAQWVSCPGSLWLSAGYPDQESEFAAEGTRAHALAEKTLRLNHGSLPICPEDPEMENYIKAYVKTIRKMTKGADMTWYEARLDLSEVFGVAEQFGTGDVIALVGSELQVHDLKYGKGVRVNAEDNLQMICYALGALQMARLITDVDKIRMCIHQVRLDHFSEWVISVAELEKRQEALQEAAIKAVRMYNEEIVPEYNPGDKQCRFCKAKAECSALKDYALKTVGDDFEDLTKVAELKEVDLKEILPKIDLIEKWCKAVKDKAEGILLGGGAIEGWKLVAGRGSKAWSSEEEVLKMLKSMRLREDEIYNQKLISPSQAEKLLKGPRWKRLSTLVVKGEGAPAIVPAEDKRPAWSPKPVADDFEVVKEETVEDLL